MCARAREASAVELAVEDAAKCSADDTAVWNKQGKTNFQDDMTSCGKKCLGKDACVSSCIADKEKYSSDCAGCFGALGQCTASHCLLKCMSGSGGTIRPCSRAA